jgi:hypothetical protein
MSEIAELAGAYAAREMEESVQKAVKAIENVEKAPSPLRRRAYTRMVDQIAKNLPDDARETILGEVNRDGTGALRDAEAYTMKLARTQKTMWYVQLLLSFVLSGASKKSERLREHAASDGSVRFSNFRNGLDQGGAPQGDTFSSKRLLSYCRAWVSLVGAPTRTGRASWNTTHGASRVVSDARTTPRNQGPQGMQNALWRISRHK